MGLFATVHILQSSVGKCFRFSERPFLTFFWDINSLKDLNIIPLSLQILLYHSNLPGWAVYPLQLINFFELFFILFAAKLISVKQNLGYRESLVFVLSTYVPGLLLWAITVIYLTLMFT